MTSFKNIIDWTCLKDIEEHPERFLPRLYQPKKWKETQICDEPVPSALADGPYAIFGALESSRGEWVRDDSESEEISCLLAELGFQVLQIVCFMHVDGAAAVFYMDVNRYDECNDLRAFLHVDLANATYMMVGDSQSHALVRCSAFDYDTSDGSSPSFLPSRMTFAQLCFSAGQYYRGCISDEWH